MSSVAGVFASADASVAPLDAVAELSPLSLVPLLSSEFVDYVTGVTGVGVPYHQCLSLISPSSVTVDGVDGVDAVLGVDGVLMVLSVLTVLMVEFVDGVVE